MNGVKELVFFAQISKEVIIWLIAILLSQDSAVNDEENTNGFMYNDKMIVLENGNIQVIAYDRIMEQVTLESFSRKPSAVFSVIKNFLNSTEEQNGNSKS